MSQPFHDHFSGHAALYARVRPRYPAALFAWLAQVAPHRRLAWDTGTGNGQAAVALAGHFGQVVATDPSDRQIAQAEAHPRVTYRVARAEACPVEPGTAALVTAAQAAHWFDLPAFWEAARTALAPGGVVAIWCYDLIEASPELDPVLRHLYDDVVGGYWPPERGLVDQGYRTLAFPFEEIEPPVFRMEQSWDLAALTGYLRSWSAAQRYFAATGRDPIALGEADLAAAWGDPAAVRTVRFPLYLRVGRSAG